MVIRTRNWNGPKKAYDRALCLIAAVILSVTVFNATPAMAHIVLRDAAGRDVLMAEPAARIVTNESLLLLQLALIDKNPVARLAGWAAPRRLDRGVYDAFRKRFPAIDAIPAVGGVTPATSNLESILSADPDLFVVSLWDPGWEQIAAGLEAAGIPTLFLDAPGETSRDPAQAIAFAMDLLGKAIDREEQADAFSGFMLSRYASVQDRLATLADRPIVLIDAFAGTECCSTPGRSNRLTDYLHLAGGQSLAEDAISGYDGRLNPEAVIAGDPTVYIATGGPHLAGHGGFVLGGGIDAASARSSLENVLSDSVRRELTAVREERAYGISHQLAISALSILALESFAKWIHPDLFPDLDPNRTLAEINERFLAVPLEGTFWTKISDKP
jgi:iron complex transport system substrate-binding protein